MLASRFGRGFHSVHARGHIPLTDDELRRAVPSVFADDAHESRSERYSYIPTIEVLTRLRSEGFEPFMAAQTRVRDESHREHTKHMLRLRHVNQLQANEDSCPDVLILNSHNGSSSFQLMGGCFRFVCANGLLLGRTDTDIRVPHKGDVVGRVLEGAHEVLDGFGLVRELRDDMRSLTLNRGEQLAFAKAALELRYEPSEARPAPIEPEQLLRPRRVEDQASDLWTTFNVAQESLMKGGIRGRTAANRPTTTRAVQGIDQGVKLNRALFTLAEEMKKLKA